MLRIFFDGCCEPRSFRGVACYGFVVLRRVGESWVSIFSENGLATNPWTSDATNNVAEYTALIKALEYVRDHEGEREVEIIGDSKLVIGQLIGTDKARVPSMVRLHNRLVETIESSHFRCTTKWIRSEENVLADRLSREVYRRYCMEHYGQPRVPPHWVAKYDFLQEQEQSKTSRRSDDKVL